MATNSKKTEAVEETAVTEEIAPKKETAEKMVRVKIPRSKNDEEDKFVSVNIRTWIVKRGVWVEVPECVAAQLEHEEAMIEEIENFNGAKASK